MISHQEQEIKELITQCELSPIEQRQIVLQKSDLSQELKTPISLGPFNSNHSDKNNGFSCPNSMTHVTQVSLKLGMRSESTNHLSLKSHSKGSHTSRDHAPTQIQCLHPTKQAKPGIPRNDVPSTLLQRPISGLEIRKISKGVPHGLKMKNLFLNEDDVDTYITYPPKLQAQEEKRDSG